LFDLLLVLVKYRKMILGITVAAALVSVGVALNMPNIYTATARILPPQQGQSSSMAMLGQLGSLAGAAGGALGIKNPNDLYIGMMKSRTLTDNIVA
jgi:tyrosine-protein kinase Etk/Wzc